MSIAVASFAGSLFVGCIDDPLFVPLEDAPDAGDTRAPAPDASAAEDAPAAESGPDRGRQDAGGACDERCRAAGGTCEGDTCVLACSAASPCKGTRKCPGGLACRIVCEGKQACDKVECSSSTACSVVCGGEQACNGDVHADAPAAQITCDGMQACNGKVHCKGASCAIACGASGCKPGDVKCCATQCTVDGLAGVCK